MGVLPGPKKSADGAEDSRIPGWAAMDSRNPCRRTRSAALLRAVKRALRSAARDLEHAFEHRPSTDRIRTFRRSRSQSADLTLIDRFEVGHATYVLLRDRRQLGTKLCLLTAAEHAVVKQLVQGRSTKEAAFALGITAATVRVLVMRAARRCGVAGRDALLVLAKRDRVAHR